MRLVELTHLLLLGVIDVWYVCLKYSGVGAVSPCIMLVWLFDREVVICEPECCGFEVGLTVCKVGLSACNRVVLVLGGLLVLRFLV